MSASQTRTIVGIGLILLASLLVWWLVVDATPPPVDRGDPGAVADSKVIAATPEREETGGTPGAIVTEPFTGDPPDDAEPESTPGPVEPFESVWVTVRWTEDGTPARGVWVNLIPWTGGDPFLHEAHARTDGKGVARWDARLTLGRILRGRVVDDESGEPLVGWRVGAEAHAKGEWDHEWSKTDEEGRFTVAGCIDAPYRLTVHGKVSGAYPLVERRGVQSDGQEVLIRVEVELAPKP